jgi:hypothetical protein
VSDIVLTRTNDGPGREPPFVDLHVDRAAVKTGDEGHR